ncbi:MAG: nitroreductase family protein [Sphingobacteriaceae bacterium]
MKEAKTNYPVIDLIKNRWSPRSFAQKSISEEHMKTILEAGTWAFSANNSQPWHFIYAHNGSHGFTTLLNCLNPGNQLWAKNAGVLVAVLANKKFDNGSENKIAKHDVGAANATMSIQAISMDIYSHVMGGYDAAKAIELLKIDANEKEPIVFIAFGFKDEADKLEEPFKTRELTERTRKPIQEISTQL